jgi:hypothetical protein
MDKFTRKELIDLILYKFNNDDKKDIIKKIKQKKKEVKEDIKKKIEKYIQPNLNAIYEEDLDDLDDFKLNFGLDYIEPKKRIQPPKINVEDIEKDFLKEYDDMIKKLENNDDDDNIDWFDIGAGKNSIIQSVLVPKNKFSKKEAIDYIKKHFKFRKIDENQRHNFYSFRQFDPTKGSNYSTKKLKNGVELVFEYKNKGGSLPVKTIYKSIKNGYSYPKIENVDDGFVFSKYGSDKEIQLYVNEKEKRIIINFIGTYTLFDWGNNYSYVLGKYKETKRFKRARDAFIKITDDYQNYKVILVGHSQSAVITNILNQEFPNKIYEVINLNGANLGETERDNEYNIRSKMDLVSLLHKPTKRDIIIDNKTNNILTEHKPNILERLKQDREIGR